jgi:hypothetical protein
VGDVPHVAAHVRDDAVPYGLNAKQVQGWLGHHGASFTMDVYVHLLADDLPDADFLDQLTTRPLAAGQVRDARTEVPSAGASAGER